MAAAAPGTASSNALITGPVCNQNGRGSRGQRSHRKSHTSHARCGDGVPPIFARRNQDGTAQSNSADDGAEGKREDRCEESQGQIGAQRPGNCTDLGRWRSRERVARAPWRRFDYFGAMIFQLGSATGMLRYAPPV